MRKIFSLTALIAVFALTALADITTPDKPTPKPKQEKSIDAHLRIKISDEAKEARLIIPKSQLKQLRAELEQLDETPAATAAGFDFNKAQTIAGGLFLSLAFVFGGVWLTRSRKMNLKASKTSIIVAGLFLSGALAATVALGNAGPPPETRRITGKIFSPAVHVYKFASGKIKLETSETASDVELIVPDAPADGKKSSDEEE